MPGSGSTDVLACPWCVRTPYAPGTALVVKLESGLRDGTRHRAVVIDDPGRYNLVVKLENGLIQRILATCVCTEPAPSSMHDANDGNGDEVMQILPGWHVAYAMWLLHEGTTKHLKGPSFNFTLAQTWQHAGRQRKRDVVRSALWIEPSQSWSLEHELVRVAHARSNTNDKECYGRASVFGNLPDTLAIQLTVAKGGPKLTIDLPKKIDFSDHLDLLKMEVAPRKYELVGAMQVSRGGGLAQDDWGWIRAPTHTGGQWHYLENADYRTIYREKGPNANVCSGPPSSVTIDYNFKTRICVNATVFYRQTDSLINEQILMQILNEHGLHDAHVEHQLASLPQAQHELFHVATNSHRHMDAMQNLIRMSRYLSEPIKQPSCDFSYASSELRRRRKVIMKIGGDLTNEQFYETLKFFNELIATPPSWDAEADSPPKAPKAPKAPEMSKAPPPPEMSKREKERESARLARQLEESCKTEREQQVAASRAAQAVKKAVDEAQRKAVRVEREKAVLVAEALREEEAEAAKEAAKEAESACLRQLRDARAAARVEHREAQQKKRDPAATDLQRQIADAENAAKADKEVDKKAIELSKELEKEQAVQDEAYANEYEAKMAAKAAEVAARKAANKAKKEAERAAKAAKEEAEAVVAEQRRRQEQAWVATQRARAPTPAPAPNLDPDSATTSAAPGDCIICMATKATHVIVPCGHFCLCVTCARTQNTCPLCRTPATHIIQGFF